MRIPQCGRRFLLPRGVLVLLIAIACAGRLAAQSASVEVLHNFSGPPNGLYPAAPVIQGSDGNFYGTTLKGGSYSYGTVFKVTPAGVLTPLYAFGGGADGQFPLAGLTQGSDGNFYGTTESTVFKITSAGVLTTLHVFSGGADGGYAEAGLTQGSDGNFYGTTFGGGNDGDGTIFKITPGGVLTTLYTFTGGTDGMYPDTSLIQGKDGNFYGVCAGYTSGTIFQITPTGVFRALYSITGGSGLTLGSDGNFYGTSTEGNGMVYKITPAGVFTEIYGFSGGGDGGSPEAGVTLGNDGNLYGTTEKGGSNGYGTVFRITPAGGLTVLYSFTDGPGASRLAAGLTQGNDGNFYGTIEYGSTASNVGEVFKITPAGSFTMLYTFGGDSDGENPAAGLTKGNDGNFYGTTVYGGSDGDGTVYQITPAGDFTTIYGFTGGADGGGPQAGLTLGNDGNFYGTTEFGGDSNGSGTVFAITPAGALTTVYTLNGSVDEIGPSGLTQGIDGNFYGTTVDDATIYAGGSGGPSTVFQVTPAGVFTTLYTFTGGADGSDEEDGLILGADGNFYGTTYYGGYAGISYGEGTVFQITPAGVLTTLYTFTGGPDGSEPNSLIQGSDGNFYGTTLYGAANSGSGTVFQLTPAGVLTTLYTFTGGANGSRPNTLTQGNDGNFYGTTDSGGDSNGNGTVFEVTAAGVFTTLYTFTGSDGSGPVGGLTQGNDGYFYGTTEGGGQYGLGVVYRFTVATPVVTSSTANAQVGSAFSYQIVAANSPTSFGASNLPAGLSVNAATGLISGTPTQSGNFSVGLTATNSGGTGGGTLSLTVSPAPLAPAVTSATVSAQVGSAFNYQIVATNSPTSFGIVNLPPGLSVNTTTGLISGTPTQAGYYGEIATATNSAGTGSGTLTFTVSPLPTRLPVITSAEETAQAGSSFSFQIVATNGPTSFGASDLPAGLSINAGSGLISGTPIESGDFSIPITATNSFGTATGQLYLVISPAPPLPTVTSATASAQVGTSFSFQIVATNSPTSFGATGLPAGLSVDASSGLISGTPTQSGNFFAGLTATNAGGTASGTLFLAITPAPVQPPAVTGGTASAQVGSAFSFQIVATNSPTSFSASGLPAGLTVDTATGLISGTPTASGIFNVGLAAANAGGTGAAVLTITLAPVLPIVTLVSTVPRVVAGSGEAGKFVLSLSAPQGSDLVIRYAIEGTAINGVDYELIKARKKITAGKTSDVINIIPEGDLGGASKKVVTLVLKPGTGYTIGAMGKVKVKILAAPGHN